MSSSQNSSLPTVEPAILAKFQNKPTSVIVIGMAGSGKTTLMKLLGEQYDADEEDSAGNGYFVNLDPAVLCRDKQATSQPTDKSEQQTEEEDEEEVQDLPYFANIDIRDTIKYKEVMNQHGLGPNGSIVVSLNLFATKFDQVLNFCESQAEENGHDYIFFDTPGQIEVFTWSASGSIITQMLSSTFPTCILYVVDTPRNLNPVTFMSNMMYACSIMYKTKLPFILVFNKIDICDPTPIISWINDLDVFLEALQKEQSYMKSLTKSMALILVRFYENIQYVALSSQTGEGFDQLNVALKRVPKQFEDIYLPLMQLRQQNRDEIYTELLNERMKELRLDEKNDDNNNNDISSSSSSSQTIIKGNK